MIKITPEELHQWYLDATSLLHPSSYNPKAQKPYEELTDGQKVIDIYIASKINEKIEDESTITIKFDADDIEDVD